MGAAWTPLSHPCPPAAASSPAGYLNVLVNSQWKSRWCSVRDSHLHFYQDRNRSKVAQQPLSLVGCEVVPDPSPDHLYSFRILHNGEELAKLEVLPARGGGGGGRGGEAGAVCCQSWRFSVLVPYFCFFCLRLFAFFKIFHSLSDLRVVVL